MYILCHKESFQVKNNAQIKAGFSGGRQHLPTYKEAKVPRTIPRQSENRRKRAQRSKRGEESQNTKKKGKRKREILKRQKTLNKTKKKTKRGWKVRSTGLRKERR